MEAKAMVAKNTAGPPLPHALPGFESIRRYRNASGHCRLRASCRRVLRDSRRTKSSTRCSARAWLRASATRARHRRHESLHAAASEQHRLDAWEKVAGRATRYGTASMEQLINSVLSAGGTRQDLEVKIFGGGRVVAKLSDIGARNLEFVHEFLRQEGSEDCRGRRLATSARVTSSISRAAVACGFVI
jgi:chemotaxis protein CheD